MLCRTLLAGLASMVREWPRCTLTEENELVDRSAADGAALAGNNPDSVAALEARGAAASRYLKMSIDVHHDR